MTRHLGIAITVTAFFDAHPFLEKVATTAVLALVSAVVSQLVKAYWPQKAS